MADYDDQKPDIPAILEEFLALGTDQQLSHHAQSETLKDVLNYIIGHLNEIDAEVKDMKRAKVATGAGDKPKPSGTATPGDEEISAELQVQIDALRGLNTVSLQSGVPAAVPAATAPRKTATLNKQEFGRRLELISKADDKPALSQLDALGHLFVLTKDQEAERLALLQQKTR